MPQDPAQRGAIRRRDWHRVTRGGYVQVPQRRRVRRPEVRLIRTDSPRPAEVGGLRVAAPPDVLLACAHDLSAHDLSALDLAAGWARNGYTSKDLVNRPMTVLRDVDRALGRPTNPSRLDAWSDLLRTSCLTPAGRLRLVRRWPAPSPDAEQLDSRRTS